MLEQSLEERFKAPFYEHEVRWLCDLPISILLAMRKFRRAAIQQGKRQVEKLQKMFPDRADDIWENHLSAVTQLQFEINEIEWCLSRRDPYWREKIDD